MDANTRREHILNAINATIPTSASSLAKKLGVSRQVIVGDVALLRAQGHDITATARGYMVVPQFREESYLGKVACQHTADNTQAELYCIVDAGAIAVNVIIEHEMYGEMTGLLNLKTRADVDAFIIKIKSAEVKLLSELTYGIHLHTIACRNQSHFEQVVQALESAGFLYKN